MATDDGQRLTRWMARQLESHDNVRSAREVGPHLLAVARRRYAVAVIGVVSAARVTRRTIEELVEGRRDLSFIVNVPKEGFWTGEALDFAESNGLAAGGVSELYSAMNVCCVSGFKRPEYVFFERTMYQHTHVTGLERVADRVYVVRTVDGRDVTVLLLNEYGERVVWPLRRHSGHESQRRSDVGGERRGRVDGREDLQAARVHGDATRGIVRTRMAETSAGTTVADYGDTPDGGCAPDSERGRVAAADPCVAAGIVNALRRVGEFVSGQGYGARWYLFGSATRSIAGAKDLDLLVVCEDGEASLVVRCELRDLCLRLPLHLLLLTRAEEAELGFVESQGCVAIFP